MWADSAPGRSPGGRKGLAASAHRLWIPASQVHLAPGRPAIPATACWRRGQRAWVAARQRHRPASACGSCLTEGCRPRTGRTRDRRGRGYWRGPQCRGRPQGRLKAPCGTSLRLADARLRLTARLLSTGGSGRAISALLAAAKGSAPSRHRATTGSSGLRGDLKCRSAPDALVRSRIRWLRCSWSFGGDRVGGSEAADVLARAV
jgi:hypothetical protein